MLLYSWILYQTSELTTVELIPFPVAVVDVMATGVSASQLISQVPVVLSVDCVELLILLRL